MNEELNRIRGEQVKSRYHKITKILGRIKRDYNLLIKETIDFSHLYVTIQEENKSRMGWWLNTYCPKVDHVKIKRFMSIANRTTNPDELPQSWQLKLYGLITTVHHKNRTTARKSTRKKKEKSFIFYIGKGQNLLIKKIEQMGGIDNLTREQKESLLQQFGETGDVLRRLSK